MKIYRILSMLFLAIPHACSGSSAVMKSASSVDQTGAVRIKKEDLFMKVLKTVQGNPDSEYRNRYMRFANTILQESYEVAKRPVMSAGRENKFGAAYPIHPEVLSDIMDLSQGKTVLEVAAASGENGFLLGLTGAEKVYINDIEESEIEKCRARLSLLPTDAQKIFTLVQGDCLEVFKDAQYTGHFDVIYARNIIHFLYGDKREDFIGTMYRLLKPGGCLIITANAIGRMMQLIGQNSRAYVFKTTTYLLRTDGTGRCESLSRDIEVEDNLVDVDPLRYKVVPLVNITKKGPKYENAFSSLESSLQERINDLVSDVYEEGDIGKKGKLTIIKHEAQSISYTHATLYEAFSNTDLVVLKTLLTDHFGHVVNSQGAAHSLTMLFQKPLHSGQEKVAQ